MDKHTIWIGVGGAAVVGVALIAVGRTSLPLTLFSALLFGMGYMVRSSLLGGAGGSGSAG